eukprot:1309071-Rhodomonas_salina.2
MATSAKTESPRINSTSAPPTSYLREEQKAEEQQQQQEEAVKDDAEEANEKVSVVSGQGGRVREDSYRKQLLLIASPADSANLEMAATIARG